MKNFFAALGLITVLILFYLRFRRKPMDNYETPVVPPDVDRGDGTQGD